MMVKNEGKNLERCLISLQPLMKTIDSELIIVDTGSEDSTVEIAKKYTDKVYFHLWNNDFSAMRNITISYAKGEWVLIIDADEEIENPETLAGFLNSSNRNEFVAGSVTIKNLLDDGLDKSINVTNAVRLLKNSETLTFTGSIHEAAYKSGNLMSLKTIFKHYGYMSNDKELFEKKHKRNLPLLLAELEKTPDNIYYRNYTCAQYFVHQEFEKALEQVLKGYETVKRKKLNPKNYMFLYSKLAFCYIRLKKYKEAENTCLEGLHYNDEHLDLHFVLALIEMENKSYDSAVEHYQRYLYLMDNFDKLSISFETTANFGSIGRYDEVYINLANIYIDQKKYDLALKNIQMVTNENFTANIYGTYIKLFVESRQFNELKKYFENTVLSQAENVIDTFLLAVEVYREKLDENEWIDLLKEFSAGSSAYSKYCEIRLAYIGKKQELNDLIKAFIAAFNINKVLYADILYYLIDLKEDIKSYVTKTANEVIKASISVLSKRFDNFLKKVTEYLDAYNENTSFEMVKLNKYLYLYLLSLDTLPDDKFRSALTGYINSGLMYMNKIYNKAVFENEMVYDVRDEYEAFLIYIQKALNAEKENESEYLKYMRNTLNICPLMNKGVKLLLSEHEANLKEQEKAVDQFEAYKVQVKQTIRSLVDSGHFKEAKLIIEEYRKIVGDDEEVEGIEFKISSK